MRRNVIGIIGLGLMLIGAAAYATGTTEPESVTVNFFTGKTETVEWMDALIAEFEAENPEIRVEQEFQQDASNVIKVKLASGDIPDISTVYAQDYVDQGLYVDLTDQTQWWSRVNPAIREMCTDVKSGRQYRIATNVTMAGLYYNKSLFDELGLSEAYTWDSFVENARTINEELPGVAPLFMGGKDSWMLGHLIEFMAHGVIKQELGPLDAKRAMLANDQATLRFAEPDGPMAAFATSFIQLRDEGLLNADLLTATYDNQLEAFASGEAAMISQGMWALGGIVERNPDMAENIGFAPYPPIIAGMEPTILSAEDSAYTIMSASEHQEEAKAFLSYLFRPENLQSYSEFLKSPSAFVDVEADWGPIKDEVAAALQNGVNIGFTNEAPAGFPGDDAGRMVQELYAGTYGTPLEFAQAYAQRWNTAYQDAR